MSEHVCAPVYVEEGELVCLECGAIYIYAGKYDESVLAECREIVQARKTANHEAAK